MTSKLDWDVVRPELRKMSKGELLSILGRAYALIADEQVHHVLGRWVPLDRLAESARVAERTLVGKAEQFHEDSLRGLYYDAFDVNSKNCTDISEGTETWGDEARIFFDRAVEASERGEHEEARVVFELLWDLFARIDAIERIVFFADEHASWQIWMDYRKVLPAYFASLAATADAATFGPRILHIIERHDRGQRDKGLAEARAVAATDEQRQAVNDAITHERERRLARRRR